MPYKSEKQRRYLKANKPDVAKKFDAHSKKKKAKKKRKVTRKTSSHTRGNPGVTGY